MTVDRHPDGEASGEPLDRPVGREVDLGSSSQFEKMLVVLCAGSGGDVHLDLAELDFIDVIGVGRRCGPPPPSAPGRFPVLHNAPISLTRVLDLVWPDYADLGVRLTDDG